MNSQQGLNKVYITRMGSFLPNGPVGNDDMMNVLGMVGSKTEKTRRVVLRSNGIHTRYYSLCPETGELKYSNTDMTVRAIQSLFGDGISPEMIECLSCGTTTPDQLAPSHAVMVHGDCGIGPCDISSSAGICASGAIAFKYGFMNVQLGNVSNAVVTGSDMPSPILKNTAYKEGNGTDQENADAIQGDGNIAFGREFLRFMLSDGAGAALLQSGKQAKQLGGLCLRIDWVDSISLANKMEPCMYMGAVKMGDRLQGFREFHNGDLYKNNVLTLEQDVKLLNRNVTDLGAEQMARALHTRGVDSMDIDWFLVHLSSLYFKDKTAASLKKYGAYVPEDRWFINLPKVGNVGAASIYLALEELLKSGNLKEGHKILLSIPESGRFSYIHALLEVCYL